MTNRLQIGRKSNRMNQLKTLSLRLRSSKSDVESIGEDAEGMADSTAKMRKDILGLTGVDIMIDDKSFKSTYQVMLEISKVWNDLSDIDRASLLEKIAGSLVSLNMQKYVYSLFLTAGNPLSLAPQ